MGSVHPHPWSLLEIGANGLNLHVQKLKIDLRSLELVYKENLKKDWRYKLRETLQYHKASFVTNSGRSSEVQNIG